MLVPLDEEAARAQVRQLKEAGVEAVSVCFLFSFVNPEHERRVAEIVREEFPEAFLSVSSEVLPQYREYERFSTVCLNAYIGPKVATYVSRLQDELTRLGVRTGVHLMTSASGVATAEAAVDRPVNLLMSGPVAGVVGGIWAGKQAGFENVITLDVGGTSADIGLAQEGRLRMKHLLDTKVGPYQAMIPMVDVDTIGAGGGSIAYVDQGGIFRVGPRSAGAVPGPAAYNRGGTEATATDALVNLGWLSPEAFLGGGMELDAGLARKAFEDGPADALGHDRRGGVDGRRPDPHALDGAVDRGELGAQGLRPARLRARRRGRRRAAVRGADRARGRDADGRRPALPGHRGRDGPAGDGHGLRVRGHDVSAALPARRAGAPAPRSRSSRRWPRASSRRTGSIPANVVVQRIAECRYLGQGYELRVDAPSGAIDDAWAEKVRADFHDIHEREYSRRFEESDIEIPNIRVRGIGLTPALRTPEIEQGADSPDAALRHEGERLVPGRRRAAAGADALLRAGGAQGRQPARRAGDRHAVRLDHGHPARPRGARRPLREHRDRDRRASRRGTRDDASWRWRHERHRVRGRPPARPADQKAHRGRPDHPAGARRRLPRDRQGDGGRALPDELLVDHPRVRGPRRRHLRRRGPRALRVRLHADAHRLAALVHPRLPAPARRRDRGGRRDRPQPPVSRARRTRRTWPWRCRSSPTASCSASPP